MIKTAIDPYRCPVSENDSETGLLFVDWQRERHYNIPRDDMEKSARLNVSVRPIFRSNIEKFVCKRYAK